MICLPAPTFRTRWEHPVCDVISHHFQTCTWSPSYSVHRIQSNPGWRGRGDLFASLSVSGLLHVLACKVTSKKALFRTVKVETPELAVRSPGFLDKALQHPSPRQITADDQLISTFCPSVSCYLCSQKCHASRTVLARVSGCHLVVGMREKETLSIGNG